MSFVRTALRIAAVEAVRGRTSVGDNVLDSQIAALDQAADGSLRTDQETPFVAVYLYDGKAQADGRSLVENGAIELAFEIGIAASMTVTDQETGESHVVAGMPATDRAFEMYLDLVGRQIRDALTDEANAWGQILLGLIMGIDVINVVATRSGDEGQRVAGHQIVLQARSIDDPVRGEPVDPELPFGQFLAALEASADPVYLKQAELMRAVLEAPAGADWQTLQRRLGMTNAQLLALGRGPIAQDLERATPPLTAASLELDAGHAGEASAP
ncbi:hypothetical protein [Aurantimonas phage AmM-1]|uniref:hypothetical protein n=1 Tax=Aurantimonas phage AmM-1 TaxID=1503929 RepID=UPI000540954B|nr:hypothetical protein ACQ23_gp10 [Aurantimonas phage AmM-1]BAP94467.1 hypothetical protein [Aurantimonas phage AmM-1]